jgi:hypothetical protein
MRLRVLPCSFGERFQTLRREKRRGRWCLSLSRHSPALSCDIIILISFPTRFRPLPPSFSQRISAAYSNAPHSSQNVQLRSNCFLESIDRPEVTKSRYRHVLSLSLYTIEILPIPSRSSWDVFSMAQILFPSALSLLPRTIFFVWTQLSTFWLFVKHVW